MSATSGWRDIALGDICKFNYGKSLPAENRDGGSYGVFGSNGRVGNHSIPITNGPAIIVGRKGSFGEVHFSPDACWPIDTTYYIDSDSSQAHLNWLAYRLRSLGLKTLNKAAAIPGLNREDAYRLRLLLPPLAEQKRIAAVLDAADTLRTKRRAALAQLGSITEATFVQMFGDDETASSVALAEVATRVTDGTHLTPAFVDAGVPFIFVRNVKNGRIDFRTDAFITETKHHELYRRCPVEKGDILYTTVGATYGQAAAVGSFTQFAFQRHLAHIKPDHAKVDSSYLEKVMQLPVVKRQADRWARGAAQPTINLKELREFRIPLPRLDRQRDFARRTVMIEQVAKHLRAHLAQLESLFSSLQHRAFRGEL